VKSPRTIEPTCDIGTSACLIKIKNIIHVVYNQGLEPFEVIGIGSMLKTKVPVPVISKI
jgi:hypothetical protein